MAETVRKRYTNIYKLLADHEFETNRNIPDGLKCNKCRKLLVDACQVPCGCLFCQNCINEMLAHGYTVCPGSTNFCKEEQISDYQTDHRINKTILGLVVKCPEELCSHECELINIEEHWRLCSNKRTNCPFFRFGCEDSKWKTSKMSDHLQIECYNHNKILIELIDNLRNELNALKNRDLKLNENSIVTDEKFELMNQDIQRNQNQIEILNDNLKLREEEIAVMNEEIRRNQTQIEVLKENSITKDETIAKMNIEIQENQNQIKEILKEKSCVKDETIAEINEEIRWIKLNKQDKRSDVCRKFKTNTFGKNEEGNNDKTERKKMENTDLLRQMQIFETEIDNKIEEKCAQERQINQDNIRREVMKLNDEMKNMQVQLKMQINELDKWLDKQIDGSFVWKINQTSEGRQKYEYIYSTIFYPRINPYKMQLRMRNDMGSDQLWIRLLIMSGEKDTYIKWPYQGNVTIKVFNKTRSDVCNIITKHCLIYKPSVNSFNQSEVFKFSYKELSTAGLMQDDYFIIECCVE